MSERTFIRRLCVGLSLSAVALVLACSEDDDSAVNPAAPGAGGPTTGNESLQPAPGAAGSSSGAGTQEGNPGNIALDPNRDPSAPVNLLASGAVACGGGGDFCVAPNLTCCSGGMADPSCAADGASCPDGTVSRVSCSSSASCTAGQVCCRVGGGGGGGFGNGNNPVTASCEASCAADADQVCLGDAECGEGNVCNNGVCAPAPCTATSCAAGELCCRGNGGGPGAAPACVAPGAEGLCPDDRLQVCEDAAQCPADNTCAPLFGGGFGGGGGGGGGMGAGAALVCTPPPCTPTSCEAGEVCCVGGGIFNPTCSPASETGECGGNSRLVCDTDAECAPSEGTECLPNPNGGGGVLSCRVPPPPETDAGAPDAG